LAFLGDFGKIFLGGAKTGQVVQTGAQLLGVNPVAAAGIGSAAQGAADIASKARSETGQNVAVSQATQTVPQETQQSGTTQQMSYNQFIQPASFANRS